MAISMGCSIEYDTCSYCGKKAYKTAAEHCDHIKNKLGHIIDGVPVFMINHKPKWYDLSIVIIPGDMNARVMYTVPKKEAAED